VTARLNQYYHGPNVNSLAERLHRIEKTTFHPVTLFSTPRNGILEVR
jgi:hypothetical protein